MTLGPIEAARVFTSELARTRRFDAEWLVHGARVSPAMRLQSFMRAEPNLLSSAAKPTTLKQANWWAASPVLLHSG
jgi:hypothetical protein